eukprot:CAMPEP_0167799596 /NCGR_PEP_ID=MMETSP0111_2-20121227/17135_1 /TAXON_ID=91324 /ORGANISM="Lotharella globosa, Strain CCCM811" /LENGTH=134 /DNA_ID=CAMNT_0007694505 /DNA_START=486 /DNA_END=887 /DNA_ORIENTATION=+
MHTNVMGSPLEESGSKDGLSEPGDLSSHAEWDREEQEVRDRVLSEALRMSERGTKPAEQKKRSQLGEKKQSDSTSYVLCVPRRVGDTDEAGKRLQVARVPRKPRMLAVAMTFAMMAYIYYDLVDKPHVQHRHNV